MPTTNTNNTCEEDKLRVPISSGEASPGYSSLSSRGRDGKGTDPGSSLTADLSPVTIQEHKGPFNVHYCAKVTATNHRHGHLLHFRPDLNSKAQLEAVEYEKEFARELFLDQQQRVSQFELPQHPAESQAPNGGLPAKRSGRTVKDLDVIIKDLKYRLKSIVASAVCYRVMASRRSRQKALERLQSRSPVPELQRQQEQNASSPHQEQREIKFRTVGEMVNGDIDLIFQYVMDHEATSGDPCRAINIAYTHSDTQLSKFHFWDLNTDFGAPSV